MGYLGEQFNDIEVTQPSFDHDSTIDSGSQIALSLFYPNFWFKLPARIETRVIAVRIIPSYYSYEHDKYVSMVSSANSDYDAITRFDFNFQDDSANASCGGDEYSSDSAFSHSLEWHYDEEENILCHYWFTPELLYEDEDNCVLKRKCLPERFIIIPYNESDEEGESLIIDFNYTNTNSIDSSHSPADRMDVRNFTMLNAQEESKIRPIINIEASGAVTSYDNSAYAEYDCNLCGLELGNVSLTTLSTSKYLSMESEDRGYAFRVYPPKYHLDTSIQMSIAYGNLKFKKGSTGSMFEIEEFSASLFNTDTELGIKGSSINIDINPNTEATLPERSLPYSIKKVEDTTIYYDVVINLSAMYRMNLISGVSIDDFASRAVGLYTSFVCGRQYFAVCSNPDENLSGNTKMPISSVIQDNENLFSVTSGDGEILINPNEDKYISGPIFCPNF